MTLNLQTFSSCCFVEGEIERTLHTQYASTPPFERVIFRLTCILVLCIRALFLGHTITQYGSTVNIGIAMVYPH